MSNTTKKILWGAGGSFIALFPAMLLGHVEGPDVRHTGAPGDVKLSCTESMCHTSLAQGGTPNTGGGSVTAAFSSGGTYTPGGAPITITVTVTDPAPNWSKYFGFQMTARLDSDQANGQAGHFTPGGPNQAVFCDTTDNFAPKSGCGVYPASSPAAGKPVVEFMEHAFPSQFSSAQTTPYTFTWTPPASNVGPVHFYVAGNAVNNDQNATGADHVYTNSYVLTPAAALPPPNIVTGGVLNAASFAKNGDIGAAVAPGSLVAVFGANLGAADAHAATVPFPTANGLGGVVLKFNGVPAAIKDVIPDGPFPFVNAQVPFEVQPGNANVVATVNGVDSQPVTIPIVASAPGIFTIPPDGQSNAILVFVDTDGVAKIAAPAGTNIGYPTAPIKRGTNAFFYAAGLGNMSPPVSDGDGGGNVRHDASVQPQVWIGDGSTKKQATLQFAGQAPGFPGVYQVNIQVPADAPTGTVMLWMTTPDGSVTSNQAKIAVQ